MSWLDAVKNKMKITTGDGVDHFPDWMNASFQVEYKYTEFNFVDVPGGLVKKKKAIGRKYALELIFQGPNHLIDSERFRISTDGSEAPWIIQHPLYDILKVQPTSLNYDNSQGNISKVTGTVIETMEEPPRNNFADPMDMIPIEVETSTELATVSLTEIPIPADINTMAQNNKVAYKKGVPIITDIVDANEYRNAFNTAVAYVDSATATPLLAMRSLIEVIQLPARFNADVKQRLKVLIDTFNSLRANLFGTVAVSSKQIYAGQQCALMTAICEAASTPLDTDFKRSAIILETIEQISNVYNQLVEDLDSLQTPNANSPLSFVVNADLMIKLNNLVNLTVTNLFRIALSAMSERAIICEKDTNVILLAHRLYGLDSADKNIDQIIENNDIGLTELLIVEKGRRIIYYV